jgi:flagellar motor switch protein FliG
MATSIVTTPAPRASHPTPAPLPPEESYNPRSNSGPRKAAILLVCLGDEAGAQILRQLREEEVHQITREVSLLNNVGHEERVAVMKEFTSLCERTDLTGAGGLEYATSVLMAAFGQETGKRMADRLLKSIVTDMPSIESLRKADPEHLAKVLHQEQPQALALIMCHLGTAQAARLLAALPDDLRPEVTQRMAALDQISPEVINRIAKSVASKLRILGESSLEAYGGVRAVAEVLTRLDAATTEKILEQIQERDGNLAEGIRDLMFVFDDFLQVSREALQIILNQVDRKLLPMALKGCLPEVRRHFGALMSSRAAEMLEEDMEALGAVRIRDVEEAQHKIIAVARKLQAEGLISLQSSAAEEYVT